MAFPVLQAHRVEHRTVNQHLTIKGCLNSIRYKKLSDDRAILSHDDFELVLIELNITDLSEAGLLRQYLGMVANA